MGIRSVLLLMVCISAFPAPQANAQFVTLEGRQFMVEGTPFYPNVMNYGMEFITNTIQSTDPAEIMVSPAGAYDRSIQSHYEYDNQPELDIQLLQHFAKLTSMGFNTIRLYGLQPVMYWDHPNGPKHYPIEVRHNLQVWTPPYKIDLDIPSFAGPMAEHMFAMMRHVIQLADQSGLKVILLCADDVGGTDQLTLANDQDAVDLYAAYLTRLAEELKDEPGLLAYDLWNEPIWTNYDLLNWSKANICAFTTQWYDAIRATGDAHLITLGGAALPELGAWDPAVMKIDFYSPHPYPHLSEWNGYDLQNAFDRVANELHWLGRTCPKPWLVGETGFSAEDDEVDPLNFFTGPGNQHLDAYVNGHHEMPWMMGSETEQAAYAQFSMDATRNNLGSGYSWWGFQNSRAANLNSAPGDYLGNWWAPLKFGNDDGLGLPAPWNQENAWRDKLMVNTLENYILPAMPSALPNPPTAYTNWHALSTPVYRTYHAQDQHEQPVADALAEAEWKFVSQQNPIVTQSFWDQAVSGQDGSVVLHRPTNFSGFNTPNNPNRTSFHASGAPGYSNVPGALADGTTLTFQRDLLEYAATVSDVELAWDIGRDYKAWAELTVENTNIFDSGTEEDPVRFVARHFVQVTGEFYAGYGSEVHLHTGETFPDCNSPWLNMPPPPPEISLDPKMANDPGAEAGSIELRFLPLLPSLSAFPNPCMDRLTVEGAMRGSLTVFDAHGALVHRGTKQADQLILDTRQWLPGVYRVRIETPDGFHSLSITKVR